MYPTENQAKSRLPSRDDTAQVVMRLTIRLDPGRLRQWHLRLIARLAARPATEVSVRFTAGGGALPSGVALLFALEKLIYRLPGKRTADPAEPADFAHAAGSDAAEPADLVIDLSGAEPPASGPTWRITFDGVASEAAAIGALVQSRMPVIAVVDAASGNDVVAGRPGSETKGILILAFEDLLARTATLLIAALDQAAARHVADVPRAATTGTTSLARFAARSLANAIVMRLYRLCFHAPHWRVGWRFVDGPDCVDLQGLPEGGWHDLADDRMRFYADPFPVLRDGRTHVFVEDFDHRLGRGVISAVEFGDSGPIGAPRLVLDTGAHASYPFVFEHRGEMWMVPETCGTATIDLYRATAFPGSWVKESTLVSGLVASDATLFEHGGRWWMLASVQDDGGAFSDVLHAWSAEDPLGPWRAHRRNPILVDIASARPAGRVVQRRGKLIRPVQDCTNGYGAALSLAEITRLDDDDFAQQVHATLRPGPLWPGRRLHTLNRAGRLECIDGSKSLLKF